ncbi:MAG: hypothetical protein Q7R76_00410 [Candidatus Woesearchaeota archaeon]|nr:hypothetical protein [Candidatus Woesearchaeota archaeon]
MDLSDIKKLPPEERLKKLKELETERKKEIEEARKLVAQSEHEIALEEIKRDIPIPQMTSVDVGMLFSPEEKELFKSKRFTGEKIKEQKEIIPSEHIDQLEKMIEDEKEGIERFQRTHGGKPQQYGLLLEKTLEAENKLASIYDAAKAGNVSYDQMKTVEYLQDKTEKAMMYKGITDEEKRHLEANERLIDGIRGSYRRRDEFGL